MKVVFWFSLESFFFFPLTGVHVGAERKCAVLHIERKTENLQVASWDQTQHPIPADVTCVVHVDVRTRLGKVVIHAVGKKKHSWLKWKRGKLM